MNFAAIFLLLAQSAPAATDVLTPHRVAALRFVTGAAISPDGSRIAYVLAVPRAPGKDEDGPAWAELHVADPTTGESTPFVTGDVNVSNVEWTPDGQRVSFLAKRGKDRFKTLYVISVRGGEARVALAMKSDLRAYSWSPDGTRVAAIATDEEPDAERKRKEKGFKQEIYEEDWRPPKLWISTPFDPKAKPREVKVEGCPIQVEWGPKIDRLAVSVAPTPLVDDGMMRQRIRVIDAASGDVVARIDNPGKLGAFAWSPDGERIAMISADDLNDPFAGRLLVVSARGGVLKDPLPNLDGDVQSFAWADAERIVCVLDRGVWTELAAVRHDGGTKSVLAPTGGPIVGGMTLSKDGRRAALVGSAPTHPPELFVWNEGETSPRRATRSNVELDTVRFARQEIVRHKARDGVELEGILVRPLEERPSTRYPLLLVVHGGPEAHNRNGWITSYSNPGQMAAARGYAVFYPNYRGSTGRGVAFAKLGQGDPAGKEFDDLVDAVDNLVESGIADKARVGITGGSYGGYATAWCSTRYTERFAAGVMFVGISDLVSKAGTTDIPDEEFLVHARKRPWENWSFFLERSPVSYSQSAHTPLLILHGKDDPRVSTTQSRELFRAIKTAGKAPVRLVLYPGEEHGNQRAAARLDYCLRMMQWFDHYLVGAGGAPPPFEMSYDDPTKPVEKSAAATAAKD